MNDSQPVDPATDTTPAPAPPAVSPPSAVLSPARGISPDTVRRVVLDNGMVVIIYPNHVIPALKVSLSVDAGAVFEPPELNGLAAFTARMMRRGTLRKTFEQLNSETEERGMSVGVDSGQHTMSIGGRSLAEDAGQLIATIAE